MNGGKEPATHQQRAAAGLGHRGDGAVEGGGVQRRVVADRCKMPSKRW